MSSRPLYNLNSPPTSEAVEYICGGSVQPVPSTPSLSRTGRDNGFLETMITRTTGQTSDNGMQSVVASSVVNSTEVAEQKDGSRQNDLGFDLNQTPQQKPSKKKKKFMPKVYVEGKPIRKPRKPATQEAVKPKATGGGKRKKAQKTNLKESAANKPAIGGVMSNTSLEVTGKSCRKALSFDLEKTGDVGLDDSGSEIFQNTSGSNSFTETRDAAGGTSGSWLDSVTQVDQTNGLVAANQPLEASTVVTLPRGSEVNHSRMLARDQQPELFTGNQQRQFPMENQQRQWPMENQQRQSPMENQQAWLHMKNQLCGFPVGNQQPRLAMGNQQPMYLMGTQRSALASGIQQPGGLQGNNQPMFLNQQSQQTYLPAENHQYGSPSGMQQHVMSTRGQQHGMLLDNQRSHQQPGSSVRGQQTCSPAGNQQYGSASGMQQHVMSTRGQQHELLLDNQRSHQQPGSSMRGQQTFLPAGNQQHGSPSGMQQYMSTRGQQHALLLDNQRSHQQPGSSMRGQQTCLPAGNQQYGSPSGMQQHVMSTREQQHGMLLDNQRSQLLMRNQQPGSSMRGQQTCLLAGNQQYGSLSAMQQPVMSPRQQQHGMLLENQESQFLMSNQQPGSSMRGQQPCVPLMNRQLGTPKGFTHLNQMVAANMSSSGHRPHPHSQTPATNLYMESVSRTLNGSAGTYQRSSIAGYGSSQQDIYQGNERIPSHERSNAEYFDLRKKAPSQNSALPTPDNAKDVEARGLKRQHDRAMGHMQNTVAHWPLLQQIAQSQDVERQNISTSAKHVDAAKKMRIQKPVQEKVHGVAPEVIDIEDYPTDGARKDKSGVPKTPAKKGPRGRKKAVPPPAHASGSCLAQNSADTEKGIVPETPARKGPRGRKKIVPPPPNASEIQVYQPTPAKKPSSRSKAKEKGMKSKQDSGKARGNYFLQSLCDTF